MDQLSELPFVPKWLGYPLYPGGFPVQAEKIQVATEPDGEPSTIQQRIVQYYQVCLDEQGQLISAPPLSADDFEVLRQWVIYYLHAPIWHQPDVAQFETLQRRSFSISSWAELRELCHQALGVGLDILS